VLLLLGAIAGVALQRLAELLRSQRNLAARATPGERADPSGNWILLVAAQTTWLLGTGVELVLRDRPPAWPFVLAGLALFLAGEALRLWCMRVLGVEWNARAAVHPELRVVASGPYRWIRHPNYLGVLLEFLGLGLAAEAWITLLATGPLHAVVLRRRMKGEDALLARIQGYRELMGGKGALLPRFSSRRASSGAAT